MTAFLVFSHDNGDVPLRIRPKTYDDGTPALNFTLEAFRALGEHLDVDTPLQSTDEARRFVYALAAAGMLWHFDDDVEESMFPELSSVQRDALGRRQSELFVWLPNPHELAVDAMYMSQAAEG